jgi:beta-lactamase regulating signal transducer with metallopeptidase domain
MITMSLFLEVTLKISLIVLFALAATALLRARSAAVRHWVLSAALVCAAATPVLQFVVPSWDLRLGRWSSERAIEHTRASISVQVPHERTASGRAATGVRLLGWVWFAGVAISLLILVIGLARLAWLASRSQPLRHGTWNALAEETARRYGLTRPVLLLHSEHPTLLVTWGLAWPKVILPRAARGWPEDRVRVVIAHELAHIRRRDWAVQMAAELLRSVYWFNPLLWIACRQLRQESEQACDDAVLNLGIEGSDYATHLLELARAFGHHRRTWLPAPAIVRPSSLERRIRAMLNARINRNPITRSASLATIAAVLAVTVSVAAAQTFATLSGTVFDATSRVLPEVTLVLTHVESKAKHEVRSDRSGHFEFVGLPRGDYSLTTYLAGFGPLQQMVTLAGQNVQRDLTLQVGSLNEMITVAAGSKPIPKSPAAWVEQVREQRRREFDSRCKAAPFGSNSGNIGGNIRQPVKLKDVKPEYPQHLVDANVGGIVLLEGVIGTDGFFKELHVVRPVHPDLEAAALEAVRQWQFDETILNCVPVDVPMNVTVNFTPPQ